MEKEGVDFLNQLVGSLEEAGMSLEEAYKQKNPEKFNKSKKLIIQLQNKISETTK